MRERERARQTWWHQKVEGEVRFYIVKEETKTERKEGVRSISKCVCQSYGLCYYKGVCVCKFSRSPAELWAIFV